MSGHPQPLPFEFPFTANLRDKATGTGRAIRVIVCVEFAGRFRIEAITETPLSDMRRALMPGERIGVHVRDVDLSTAQPIEVLDEV